MQKAATRPRAAGPPTRARSGPTLLASRPFGARDDAARAQFASQAGAAARAASGPSYSFGGISVQAKLSVGSSDDPLEHEADRVADQVLRMPDPDLSIGHGPSQIHRKCADCEEAGADSLRMKATARPVRPIGEPPAVVHDVLRSRGQPLDRTTRAWFEGRFGHDFSGVHVHTDGRAAESATSIGASAYTAGSHIAFAPGRFNTNSADGRRLLAHELTHVIQQRSSGRSDAPSVIQRDENDYQQGYQDGIAGEEAHAGPRDGDALTDYDQGYAKGHDEFSQKAPVAPAPAPDSGAAGPVIGPPAPDANAPAGAASPRGSPPDQQNAGGAPAQAADAGASAPTSLEDRASRPASKAIIQAVQRTVPDAAGGVGDFAEAFRILNGLAMFDILATLDELNSLGELALLREHIGEVAGVDRARIELAMSAVENRATLTKTGFQPEQAAAFAALPVEQQADVTTYLGGTPGASPGKPEGGGAAGGTAGGGGLTTGEIVAIAGAALFVGAIILVVASGGAAAPVLAAVMAIGSATADVGAGAAVVGETIAVQALATGAAASAPIATVTLAETAVAGTAELAAPALAETALAGSSGAATATATAATTTAATTTAATTTAATTTAASTTAATTTAAIAGAATTTLASDSSKPSESGPGGRWGCDDVRCNVYSDPQANPPNPNCPDRVVGASRGWPDFASACLAAQRDANNQVPRGCVKRHCNCRTKCRKM